MRPYLKLRRLPLFIVLLFLLVERSVAQGVPVLEWAVGNSGNTGQMIVYASAVDAGGNSVVCGQFRNSADFDPGPGDATLTSAGATDIFIVKIDGSGTYAWAQRLGATGDDVAKGVSIDAAGNIYVTGEFQSTVDFDNGTGVATLTTASTSGFVLKLASNGDYVWARSVGLNIAAVQASSTAVVFTGRFLGTVDLDPGAGVVNRTSVGASDIFVERLDTDGNFVWVSTLGGVTGEDVNALAMDAVGNVYTTGDFGGTADFDPGPPASNLVSAIPGTHDVFLSKLDASGNFVWAKDIARATATAGLAIQPLAICVDAASNVFTSGTFLESVYDFDPGAGTLTPFASSADSYISKLDINGDLVWAKKFSGSGSISDNIAYSMKADASGNLLVTAGFENIVNFDPNGSTFLTAPGNGGTAIVKLTPAGTLDWARVIGGVTVGNPPRSFVAIGVGGELYVSGNYNGTKDFDPTPCAIFNLTGAGSQDPFFVTKLLIAPLHTITSFTPASGPVGTSVTIDGTDFGPSIATNGVTFFSNRVATITAANTISITATVPPLAATGRIRVTVNCIVVQSATNFTITVGSSPTISSFTPVTGPVGTTVTITGTNFSTTPASNTVSFNGTNAVVTASTTTSITTTVPAGATTGKISVTVGGNTATSVADFTVTIPSPTITSFTPTSGPVGTTVNITGTNFSTTPASNTVAFNGTNSVVTASTATSITATVPTAATTGKITVTVGGNTATSAGDFTVTATPPPAPTITSFTPTSGPVGTVVIITGTNFSTTSANNVVVFNGTSAVVSASTATSLTTSVPSGATTGKISVTVSANTATSASDFTVTTPGTPTGTVTIATETISAVIAGMVTKDLVPLITTSNNNLDISSITVIAQPPSGAQASVSGGVLTVDYTNTAFSGTESITIRACDTDGNCTTQTFEIEVAGALVVFNALSPDGRNPIFRLSSIDLMSETRENTVYIYNRWGDEVFSVANYNNTTNIFTGYSSKGNKLPAGTYFYKVIFASGRKELIGYLELRY